MYYSLYGIGLCCVTLALVVRYALVRYIPASNGFVFTVSWFFLVEWMAPIHKGGLRPAVSIAPGFLGDGTPLPCQGVWLSW